MTWLLPSLLAVSAKGALVAALVALVLARRLTTAWRLRRHLAHGRPVTDRKTLRLLEEARRSLGIRRTVGLLELPHLDGPGVTGWLRPQIVLPRGLVGGLDPEAMRHVVLHELAHVRRLDGPLRAVASLVAAVHWFNPLAWLTLRRLDAECEAACDATVLAHLPRGAGGAYGRTLIALAARVATGPTVGWNPAGAPILGLSRKRHLKRRVLMIARYRPTSPGRLLACALLFAAVAVVALTDAPAPAHTRPATLPGTSGSAAPQADGGAQDEKHPATTLEERDRGPGEGSVGVLLLPTEEAANGEDAEESPWIFRVDRLGKADC